MLRGEGIMTKRGPARPVMSGPAPWAVAKRIKKAVRVCPQCGEQFSARPKQRLCSPRCSNLSQRARVDRSCAFCGVSYYPRRDSRFCSDDCRIGAIKRPCPDDFEATLVEIGRLACEEHYSASDDTITRWLDALGKERLLELRRLHVKQQRTESRIGRAKARKVAMLERDTEEALGLPNPLVVAMAVDHLRTMRGGGFAVSGRDDGDWTVGIGRRTSGQLIAMAERHGFDVEAATLRAETDVRLGSG